ncbi:hypothetical protein V3473_30415, partial [Pseudomonas aeruginosa]|uniref:hypothetical protein n=1 Tax=Pseudomonas aeruginosa TaxID=287 RepID=UPI002F9586CA
MIRKMGQSCQAPGGAGLVKSLVSCGFFDRESLSASLIPLGCFVPLVSILCHRRLRNAKPRSGQTAPDSQAAFLSLRYSLALKISATPGVDEYKCSGQPIPDSGLSFSSATAGGNPSL